MIEKRDIVSQLQKVDQGDIFKNIKFFKSVTTDDDSLSVSEVEFDYVLVLSQSCDLARAFDKNPNSLLSVLIVPLFPFTKFKEGTYLDMFGVETQKLSSRVIGIYKNNQIKRYYTIEMTDEEKIENGFIDSYVADFKYFFTADLSQFSTNNYVISLKPYYREEATHSFANYVSRIGVPDK